MSDRSRLYMFMLQEKSKYGSFTINEDVENIVEMKKVMLINSVISINRFIGIYLEDYTYYG